MEKRTKKILFGVSAATLIFLLVRKPKKGSSKDLNTLVNANLTKQFGAKNKKFVDELNGAAKPVFVKFLNDITNMGYSYVINNTYRPTKEQVALKKKDSRNATPGFSTHEYGIGLDLSLVKNGVWINKKSSIAEWNKTGIPQLAKDKYKMRWGGDFKGYLDPVHFDLGNTYDVNKLYKKALVIYGSAENIKGNQMKLV